MTDTSETSYIVLATFEREGVDFIRAYGPMLWDDVRKARNKLFDELGAYSVQVFQHSAVLGEL